MSALRIIAILAALISVSACASASKFSQEELDKAKQQTSLIGLDISPQLRTAPSGPNPNPPRGKKTSAIQVNSAWNKDRDLVRACVIQYNQLLGETDIIVTEIKKMTSDLSDDKADKG